MAADGTPRVHRIVAAVDCGQVVNPEIVKRQVEGGRWKVPSSTA
jgi:isoquinoline 1-oxidoreductase beta subunit